MVLLAGCKTNKNTVVHRGYHNLTARFNGYYYATESIREGEEKIRVAYKYDYDQLLPVFLVPTNESAKATFPEFDKAIKKSTNCIQRHTIKDKKGNEIPKAGHWIDNNWNVIGVSHFYKREFFSGIEAFEYVIRTYKTKDRYNALIWLARSYNEIGAPSQAEPVIGLLKDDKKIPWSAKKQLPAVQADYYIKRGMYEEAKQSLITAIKFKPHKKDKARYSFILAQLFEERHEHKKAVQYYQKTIAAKPSYELVFHAKMKQARLFDAKNGNTNKLKRDLQNMTRDIKNQEYLDIIYYTLGVVYEKEKNEELAIVNYKLSVKNSTQNPKQKALSYLKLGELSFEQGNYTLSGQYYDSTMITLPKEYKDYDLIQKRKTTLETLVGYIRTIQKEDSLQRIARMSVTDRDRFITTLMKKLEADEDRKKEEQEKTASQNNILDNNPNISNNGLPVIGDGSKGNWYFYNQTTLSFGVNDFIKKWGNRKLEDHWRRSQKSLTIEPQAINNTTNADAPLNTKDSTVVKAKQPLTNKKDKAYYLADLPLTDTLLKLSNNRIIDAYYNLGSTYKEELNNNKKAIATFEELNNRFAEHKYKLSIYYQLYRIYTSVKNQPQADFYKNKLLNEYPNSEYAQIIKNPNYVTEKNIQKGEVELFYTETYHQYAGKNYGLAFERCKEAEKKYGNTDFSGKFAFMAAMCTGKLKGADSLEMALKQLQVLYPKDPTATQAQEILNTLYSLKHPSESTSKAGSVNQADTFLLELNAPHLVVVVCADEAATINSFKNALAEFNSHFYSSKNLTVSTSLFGSTQQITNVKPFDNADEALAYIQQLKNDKTVFSGNVKLELFTIMAISANNTPLLYRKKQVEAYKPFYDDHYKK